MICERDTPKSAMDMSVSPPADVALKVLGSMLKKKCLRISAAMDKSVLHQVHLETSVALHEVMLEHLKECGHA